MWGRQFQFPLEEKIIRRRASRKKAYLEAAFELGTRFVHGLVAFQQLHDKNSEVLVGSGAHRDGHGTHARGAAQMNLMGKKGTLKMESISFEIPLKCISFVHRRKSEKSPYMMGN